MVQSLSVAHKIFSEISDTRPLAIETNIVAIVSVVYRMTTGGTERERERKRIEKRARQRDKSEQGQRDSRTEIDNRENEIERDVVRLKDAEISFSSSSFLLSSSKHRLFSLILPRGLFGSAIRSDGKETSAIRNSESRSAETLFE